MIDIGVNFTSSAFSSDRDQVVEHARQQGVTDLILTGSSVSDSREALALTQLYPNCYATAGVHPHHASEFDETTLGQLRELIASPQVKAVGETGLDFNRNYSPQAAQISAFEQQLELACELQLPVFLHQRDAHSTFYPIIKNYRDKLCDAVAHCFTGPGEELRDYLDLDMHIGITGWICDERRGTHLQALVKEIPLDRLMLETDAPYLLPRNISPKPKSRRNEPALLTYVVSKVAECLEMPQQEVAERTAQTAKRFFRLDQNPANN